MRIGEAAAAAHTTTKTLRFYEEYGLLPAIQRTAGGYRRYSPETIERIRFIKRSKDAGLSLAQTRDILLVRDAGTAPCREVLDQLEQQLERLDRQIAELTALRASVAAHHRSVAAADPARCKPGEICSYL